MGKISKARAILPSPPTPSERGRVVILIFPLIYFREFARPPTVSGNRRYSTLKLLIMR